MMDGTTRDSLYPPPPKSTTIRVCMRVVDVTSYGCLRDQWNFISQWIPCLKRIPKSGRDLCNATVTEIDAVKQ